MHGPWPLGLQPAPISRYPAAAHELADAHDTVPRTVATAPAGTGSPTVDHPASFHRAAIGRPCLSPNAVHTVPDTHETLPNRLFAAPRVPPSGWIDHRRPLKLSTSALPMHGPGPFVQPAPDMNQPTAVHEFCDEHDTPSRTLRDAPCGAGAVPRAHRWPFQRSNSGSDTPVVSFIVRTPTAMQNRADTHETPFSASSTAVPCGCAIDQV